MNTITAPQPDTGMPSRVLDVRDISISRLARERSRTALDPDTTGQQLDVPLAAFNSSL